MPEETGPVECMAPKVIRMLPAPTAPLHSTPPAPPPLMPPEIKAGGKEASRDPPSRFADDEFVTQDYVDFNRCQKPVTDELDPSPKPGAPIVTLKGKVNFMIRGTMLENNINN
jgi:hypothetical protein